MDTCSVECKAECCKRWWITLLPGELERAADFSRIPGRRFVEEKCVLYAELFPMGEREQGIVVYNELLPKGIAEKVRECFGFLPDFFLALPFIALKRIEGNCVFLDSANLCSIYAVRPGQCRLFPSISLEESDKPGELYRFCGLAGSAEGGLDSGHMKRVRDYFSEVGGCGFSKTWHFLPGRGIVKIRSDSFEVSREDFLALLGPYS